ncbi:hypothetical protein BOV93_10565 [Solemya velum gill symbiont]|nr:hypothetical protein BOV93_10565 [Solemya velum gill symbiont]
MTNLEKIELILFVYTVSNAMLISTSKIVGKTVVVRVRRCVVGDFFIARIQLTSATDGLIPKNT